MDRLNQHNFKDFLSTAKETEPEELARMMWPDHGTDPQTDRKSTRLNSSHGS